MVHLIVGRIHFAFGSALILRVSPHYKVALPACTDLGEMFTVRRSYDLGLPQSWVVGLQFISFVFVFKTPAYSRVTSAQCRDL